MDISILTPAALKRLTPEKLQSELRRLTPEQRKDLKPEQVAAVMETIDPRYRLTPDEQRRREAALQIADVDDWHTIASTYGTAIVRSCELGDLTLEEAINIAGRISIGCWPQTRVHLLGVVAALALRVPSPRKRKPGETRPRYPSCIQSGTADLVLWLKENQPEKRRSPTEYRNSPLIEEALRILEIMRWFGTAPTPAPKTIDGWVTKRRAEQLASGQTLPKGRPPRTHN